MGFWERSDTLPSPKVLVPMARILGVTVDELVGESKTKRAQPAGGKLGQVFERVSKLPRRQQQKVIEMAEGFLSLHERSKGKTDGS